MTTLLLVLLILLMIYLFYNSQENFQCSGPHYYCSQITTQDQCQAYNGKCQWNGSPSPAPPSPAPPSPAPPSPAPPSPAPPSPAPPSPNVPSQCQSICNQANQCQQKPNPPPAPKPNPPPAPKPNPPPAPKPNPPGPSPGPQPQPSGNWLKPCAGMSTTPGSYASPSSSGVASGMCVGNNILPASSVSTFWNQKKVNIPGVGNNIPVALGHCIKPLANPNGSPLSVAEQKSANTCGKCYVVKSSKTGKMAVIMGVDGVGGVDHGTVGKDCSPEMAANVASQIFDGNGAETGREDFTYMVLDKCPGL